jgi:hypothetical protein
MRTTAQWYADFGAVEAAGQSAIFEEWALGVSTDDTLLALLETLPTPKRQPNLLFACARLLGCPEGGFGEWREWLLYHWDAVTAEMLVRRTQTNEPRRCAVLLPTLALIDGPIALLEVGASAGLCLFPDRYSYIFRGEDGDHILDPVDGPSDVVLDTELTGPVPIPERMPDIVWRAGLDLHPLDLTNDDDTRWLETLVWPEQHERRERIRAAMRIARANPPRIIQGDAVDALAGLAAQAPKDATLVILSSATLVYLMPEPRARFVELVGELGARWISLDGRGLLPSVDRELGDRVGPQPQFVMSLDGHPVAFVGPHGQRLDWLTPALHSEQPPSAT